MTDDSDEAAGDADERNGTTAGGEDRGAADATGEDFEADRERARELFEGEVDGLYAGVVRDDELDYVFSHRIDDPEQVGMQALSLLAHHVGAIADQAGIAPAQVAEDAGRLAARMADDGSDGGGASGRPEPGAGSGGADANGDGQPDSS